MTNASLQVRFESSLLLIAKRAVEIGKEIAGRVAYVNVSYAPYLTKKAVDEAFRNTATKTFELDIRVPTDALFNKPTVTEGYKLWMASLAHMDEGGDWVNPVASTMALIEARLGTQDARMLLEGLVKYNIDTLQDARKYFMAHVAKDETYAPLR